MFDHHPLLENFVTSVSLNSTFKTLNAIRAFPCVLKSQRNQAKADCFFSDNLLCSFVQDFMIISNTRGFIPLVVHSQNSS